MKELLTEHLLATVESETELSERDSSGWIIRFEDLKFQQRLSEGSFGIVCQGVYQGSPVAIKILKEDSLHDDFENEVKILKSLRHPNIVLFMGVCSHNNSQFIITELMNGGSLASYIKAQNYARATATLHQQISFSKKVQLLLDVCRGIVYLHSLTPVLCHRDLKPSNILLDKQYLTAKVCDFGASKFMHGVSTMTGNVGTLLYCSPEVLRNKHYTEKCDTYSFGIIMYEVFFETLPYSEKPIDNMVSLALEVVEGKRPALLDRQFSEVEQKYIALMEQCWMGDPIKRPSFSTILTEMEDILVHI